MKVEFLNFEQLVRLVIRTRREALPELGRALHEEANIAFRKSQRQVPFRLGTLKGSGRVFPPEQRGGQVEQVLGYGGAAKKYAMAMHEGNYHFRRGKKRYYLKDPVEDRVEGLDNRIAKRINKIIKENRG